MSPSLLPQHARCLRIPLFLVPALAETVGGTRTTVVRTFSTSQASASRRLTGPNKQRGVSAIRSKNPKPPTEVYRHPLPVPVFDPARRALFPTSPDHGLWGFFDKKKSPMISPEAEAAHGRPWTVAELGNNKEFSELHKLYWTCVLEQNRIATRISEMKRTRAGYGQAEASTRLKAVKTTMSNIRLALQRRYTNWLEARALLAKHTVEELLEPESDLEEIQDEGPRLPPSAPTGGEVG